MRKTLFLVYQTSVLPRYLFKFCCILLTRLQSIKDSFSFIYEVEFWNSSLQNLINLKYFNFFCTDKVWCKFLIKIVIIKLIIMFQIIKICY